LVKLPRSGLLSLAKAALSAGADALVVGAAPKGGAYNPTGTYLSGRYYGTGIVPQYLPDLIRLNELQPEIPLVGSGGVHGRADVKAYLSAGCAAVQLDTLIFTNPGRVQQLLRETAAD